MFSKLRSKSRSSASCRQARRRRLSLGFEMLDARRVLATITGTVFDDLNASGVLDGGESGLADRVVYLDQNFNGVLDVSEPLRLTDGSGNFSFDDVSTGGQHVRLFDGTGTQTIVSPDGDKHALVVQNDTDSFTADFALTVSGDNTAPTSPAVNYDTNEDVSFTALPPNGVLPKASDAQGNQFIAIQQSESANGQITISTNGMVRYQSKADFNGQDTATYLLTDGRNASELLTLTINVSSVDDPATGIELDNDSVTENSPGGTVIGTVSVLDPDLSDLYYIFVQDNRFQVQDNLLIVAPGAILNFEDTPEIKLVINAENADLTDGVSREFTIKVLDADDPVSGVWGPTELTISEDDTPRDLGLISYYEEDYGQTHDILLSDDRFEMLPGDILAMREGMFLSYPADDGMKLVVTVDDPAATPANKEMEITIRVANIIHPPLSVEVSGSVVEQRVGAEVGAVTVIDADPEDVHTFSVSDSRFEVVAGILKLKDDQYVVYQDDGPTINLTVTATDPDGASVSVDAQIPVIETQAPWQNLPDNLDVNGDGVINPLDILIVLNALNEGGPMVLPTPFQGDLYVDVNGDGLLTPLDALIIVNHLNESSLFPSVGTGESPSTPPSTMPEGEAIVQSGDAVPTMWAAPQYAFSSADGDDEDEDWRWGELIESMV